jgi:sulfate adenylyltransferase subunit 1
LGRTLLDTLETTDVHHQLQLLPARFPVQYVIRPRNEQHHDYRGCAGRVVSGSFAVGDNVLVLPSGQGTAVQRIERFDETLDSAYANQSVMITLKDIVDVSRGDALVKALTAQMVISS